MFSINIFLDLYAKDRSDYCFTGSHSELMCGRQAPWTAEVFNAVPWILTGIFLFAVIYFPTRKFLLNSVGSRVTPRIGRQVAVGSLIAAVLISVVTWPVYENGFWDYGGLGAMDDMEDLDALRAQPSDTLVHVEEGNVWGQWEDECIPYEESQGLVAWNGLAEGEDVADWCVIAATHWSKWGIYQPTKFKIIDFNGDNGHADSETGRNSAEDRTSFFGLEDGSELVYSSSFTFEVEDLGVSEVPTDIGCLFRTSVRSAGTHSQSLVLTDSAGSELWRTDGCISESIYLDSGQSYTIDFQTTSQGINDSVEVITSFSVISYQPLLLNEDGTALVRSESTMDLETLSTMYMENPTFEKNPKSLDAKLIYSLFVPCLGVGALVFMLMRSMARGYEYEMNKCYGCDLCDDACPVRLFNSGDKLNIIYNTWNNEDDGVPLYSCLTCSACTNACPQLVDYDSYVDIRRNMIVGGPPARNSPHCTSGSFGR